TRCIKIPTQQLLSVDPLFNLLLPLFSYQLSGALFLFSLQGSTSFQLSGAHFLFSLHGSAFFQLFLAPSSCSASWLHILFNPLPAYSIENYFGIRFRFVISFQVASVS